MREIERGIGRVIIISLEKKANSPPSCGSSYKFFSWMSWSICDKLENCFYLCHLPFVDLRTELSCITSRLPRDDLYNLGLRSFDVMRTHMTTKSGCGQKDPATDVKAEKCPGLSSNPLSIVSFPDIEFYYFLNALQPS